MYTREVNKKIEIVNTKRPQIFAFILLGLIVALTQVDLITALTQAKESEANGWIIIIGAFVLFEYIYSYREIRYHTEPSQKHKIRISKYETEYIELLDKYIIDMKKRLALYHLNPEGYGNTDGLYRTEKQSHINKVLLGRDRRMTVSNLTNKAREDIRRRRQHGPSKEYLDAIVNASSLDTYIEEKHSYYEVLQEWREKDKDSSVDYLGTMEWKLGIKETEEKLKLLNREKEWLDGALLYGRSRSLRLLKAKIVVFAPLLITLGLLGVYLYGKYAGVI